MSPRRIPVIDRMTDAVFALDTNFRITYHNDRAKAILSTGDETVLGNVLWDVIPEPIETEFPTALHHALDESIPVTFDIYHTILETWFEARVYPDEHGVSVFMHDVTDRKDREETLATHTAVVEQIHAGIVTLDRSNRITSVNNAIEHVLDVDRSRVQNCHVETLLEAASVEPSDAVEIGHALTDVAIGNVSYRMVEFPFVNANEISRIGELMIVPIDHDRTKIACVIRDVTDERAYERVVTSLHELTRWLVESDDPDEICAIAVHAGSNLLSMPISGIWLLDDERGYLEPVAGTANAHDEFGGLPRFHPGDGLIWDVFEDGEIQYYEDVRSERGVYNPETPIRSEIIAPIGTFGILMTGSRNVNQFDETDVELVATLTANTRSALESAKQERILRNRTAEIERQTERLEAIADVLSTDLTDHLDAIAAALEHNERDTHDTEWEFPLAEETVTTTLERIDRLVGDVEEFARNTTRVETRRRISLEDAMTDALEVSHLDDATMIIEDQATVRVDPDRFERLLQTLFDAIHVRATNPVTIRVGLRGLDSSSADMRGIYIMDDASKQPVGQPKSQAEPGVINGASFRSPNRREDDPSNPPRTTQSTFDESYPRIETEPGTESDTGSDTESDTVRNSDIDTETNTDADADTDDTDTTVSDSSVGEITRDTVESQSNSFENEIGLPEASNDQSERDDALDRHQRTTDTDRQRLNLREAVITAIADAHDWTVSIESDRSGTTITTLHDITTLERDN